GQNEVVAGRGCPEQPQGQPTLAAEGAVAGAGAAPHPGQQRRHLPLEVHRLGAQAGGGEGQGGQREQGAVHGVPQSSRPAPRDGVQSSHHARRDGGASAAPADHHAERDDYFGGPARHSRSSVTVSSRVTPSGSRSFAVWALNPAARTVYSNSSSGS